MTSTEAMPLPPVMQVRMHPLSPVRIAGIVASRCALSAA